MARYVQRNVPTAVYRFYGTGGDLLYVGMSMNLEGRFRSHRKFRGTDWQQFARIELTWYPNRGEASTAETLAIETESPRWNATGPAARPMRMVEDLTRTLADRIKSGTYPPGSRLPSWAKLEEEFGVSEMVIRGAMRSLKAMGLVEPIHGVGTFVAEKEA